MFVHFSSRAAIPAGPASRTRSGECKKDPVYYRIYKSERYTGARELDKDNYGEHREKPLELEAFI